MLSFNCSMLINSVRMAEVAAISVGLTVSVEASAAVSLVLLHAAKVTMATSNSRIFFMIVILKRYCHHLN